MGRNVAFGGGTALCCTAPPAAASSAAASPSPPKKVLAAIAAPIVAPRPPSACARSQPPYSTLQLPPRAFRVRRTINRPGRSGSRRRHSSRCAPAPGTAPVGWAGAACSGREPQRVPSEHQGAHDGEGAAGAPAHAFR